MPPWPSVFAGALRSAILQWDKNLDLEDWKNGRAEHPIVGHWKNVSFTPGSFKLGPVFIARDIDGKVEACHFPPQDLLLSKEKDEPMQVIRLSPQSLASSGLRGSAVTPQIPAAPMKKRRKPATGWLLRQPGFVRYLNGESPQEGEWIRQENLWTTEIRTGIALNNQTRTVEESKLFSVQLVKLHTGVGFVVGVEGTKDALPDSGLLRLGGDGHAARFHRIKGFEPPAVDETALAKASRLRLVTLAPAILDGGWRPEQADGLISAAVHRAQVVSGWDLKNGQPKTAQRAVSAGSVYWFKGISAEQVYTQWQKASQRSNEGFGQMILAVG